MDTLLPFKTASGRATTPKSAPAKNHFKKPPPFRVAIFAVRKPSNIAMPVMLKMSESAIVIVIILTLILSKFFVGSRGVVSK